MDNNRNYFKDAGEFLKGKEFDTLEEELIKYFKENNFSENERHLFVYHLEGQVGLKGTMAKLKCQIEEPNNKNKNKDNEN